MRLRYATWTVVIGVALLGAACGSDESASEETTQPSVESSTTTTVTTTTVAPTTTSSTTTTTTVAPTTTTSSPPAELTVEVNGAQLSYECQGEGSPTVVVEVGSGNSTRRSPTWWGWDVALDEIASTNTVCIYGRRGIGGSDPLPADTVRTTQDQVDDLDGLITALDLETPLILVGHSLAGWNLPLYADQHPERVAGLVYVDGIHPEFLEVEEPIPPKRPEWLDEPASAEQVKAVADLADIPLYVLTASETPPDGIWAAWQEDIATFSTNSYHTTVQSSHVVYRDDPSAVAAGVAWVVEQLG